MTYMDISATWTCQLIDVATGKVECLIPCYTCGTDFVARVRSAMYCSEACKLTASRVRRGVSMQQMAQRVCVWCGKQFMSDNKQHMYCSDKCNCANNRKRPRIICDYCGILPVASSWHHYCATCRVIVRRNEHKRYRQTPKGRAVERAYQQSDAYKAWRKEYRQSAKGKAANERYNKSPKGRASRNMIGRIHKQRKRANDDFDVDAWHAKLARCDYRCVMCGTTDRIEIDHIIPVSKGGTNHINNLQPLCRSCNASKGARIC